MKLKNILYSMMMGTAVLTGTMDNSFYPRPRTYSVSLGLQF